MDTAAVVIPIPVQPIEPQQPAPDTDPAAQADSGVPDFASTLEQQLAQTAAVGANAAELRLTGTEDGPEDGHTGSARDPATPDDLIAMMAAPRFAQAPPPAPAETGPAGAAAAMIAPAHGDSGTTLATPVAGTDMHEQPAVASRGTPLEPIGDADADELHTAQPLERAAAATGLPQAAEARAPSTLGALHAPSTPAVHGAVSAPARGEPHIAARVGTADWHSALAQQVTIMAKDGEHTAQLRLDPPELGPLEVRLSMARDRDGVAHAQFVSPHAAVRDALEAALPQLRAVLADNGITLGQASVGEGFARSDARQPQRPGGNSGGDHQTGDEPGVIGMPRAMVRHGLVDTFA